MQISEPSTQDLDLAISIGARRRSTQKNALLRLTSRRDDSSRGWLELADCDFVQQRLWEAITVRSVLPKPHRDLRLDRFRGLRTGLSSCGNSPQFETGETP